MILDLGEYRFLKFVNTFNDPFKDDKHTYVYFLVLTPECDAVRLMYYK